MPKPLYHGSPLSLDRIEPRPSSVLEDAAAVFATPKRHYALVFAAPWTDDDLELGAVNNQDYIKEMYPGALEKIYAGKSGYIHKLPPGGFSKDPRLMRVERISKEPVKPLDREYVENILKALQAEKKFKLYKHDELLPGDDPPEKQAGVKDIIEPGVTLTSAGGLGVGARIKGTPLVGDMDLTGPGAYLGMPPSWPAAALRMLPFDRTRRWADSLQNMPGRFIAGGEMLGFLPVPAIGVFAGAEDVPRAKKWFAETFPRRQAKIEKKTEKKLQKPKYQKRKQKLDEKVERAQQEKQSSILDSLKKLLPPLYNDAPAKPTLEQAYAGATRNTQGKGDYGAYKRELSEEDQDELRHLMDQERAVLHGRRILNQPAPEPMISTPPAMLPLFFGSAPTTPPEIDVQLLAKEGKLLQKQSADTTPLTIGSLKPPKPEMTPLPFRYPPRQPQLAKPGTLSVWNYGKYFKTLPRGDAHDYTTTLRKEIAPYYANAPGGIDRAVSLAQQRLKNPPPAWPNKALDWEPEHLDKNITYHVARGKKTLPGVGEGVEGVTPVSLFGNSQPIVAGDLSPDRAQLTKEHELTHAAIGPGPFNRAAQKPVMSYATLGPDQQAETSPDYHNYSSMPAEMQAFLAPVRRMWTYNTGRQMETPADAEEAIDWWLKNAPSDLDNEGTTILLKSLYGAPGGRREIIDQLLKVVGGPQAQTLAKTAMLNDARALLPYRERAEMYPLTGRSIFGGKYDDSGSFGVFGGGVDEGEDPALAAAREFFEETGWRVKNSRLLPVEPHTVEWKPPFYSAKQEERANRYRGSRTHYVTGELGGQEAAKPPDTSNLIDHRPYDIDEAVRMSVAGKHEGETLKAINDRRQQVLAYIRDNLLNKQAAAQSPDAYIIKGNPQHLRDDPENYGAFYDSVKKYLESKGLTTAFDAGDAFTVPPGGKYWVGHSRGVDRLQFAPKGVKTLALDDYEGDAAFRQQRDAAMSQAIQQVGGKHLADVPFEQRAGMVTPEHYTFNDAQRAAIDAMLAGHKNHGMNTFTLLKAAAALRPQGEERRKRKAPLYAKLLGAMGLGTLGAGAAATGLAHGLASDTQAAAARAGSAFHNPEFYTQGPHSPALPPGHTQLTAYIQSLAPSAELRPFGAHPANIIVPLRSNERLMGRQPLVDVEAMRGNTPELLAASQLAPTLLPGVTAPPAMPSRRFAGIPYGKYVHNLADTLGLKNFLMKGINAPNYALLDRTTQEGTSGRAHYQMFGKGPIPAYYHFAKRWSRGKPVPDHLRGPYAAEYSDWIGGKFEDFLEDEMSKRLTPAEIAQAGPRQMINPLEVTRKLMPHDEQIDLLKRFHESLTPEEQAFRRESEAPGAGFAPQAEHYLKKVDSVLDAREDMKRMGRNLRDIGVTAGGAGLGGLLGHYLHRGLRKDEDKYNRDLPYWASTLGGAGAGGLASYFGGTSRGRELLRNLASRVTGGGK